MRTALVLFIVAASACGPSWPQLTGKESLTQLRTAVAGSMKVDGKTLKQAEIDCKNQDSEVACRWLSAFWQADAANAAARCERGERLEKDDGGNVYDACAMAACYALGLNTVRYLDADPDDGPKPDAKEDVIPRCPSQTWGEIGFGAPIMGIAESRLKPPPINAAAALGYLAKGCAINPPANDDNVRRDVVHDCDTLAGALAGGLIAGIAIRRDLGLARSIWERGETVNEFDPKSESQWQDFAGNRVNESDSDREARIARVQAGYASWAKHNSKLAADYDNLNDSSGYVQAAAAGFSAGAATVAASSPRMNTPAATAPASDARASVATQQQTAQAQQQAAQSQARAAQGQEQQQAAAKAAKLKQCLDEDQDCTYGTSNRCQPATAYGDHWTERGDYDRAQTTLKVCGSERSFTADCGSKVLALTPNRAGQREIASRISDLEARATKLPSSYGCVNDTTVTTYNGSSVDDYCGYARNYTSCMQLLVGDVAALEAARKLDECVYYGTFQYTRDQLRAQHDAECHKQFD
jgi:hypothetical protein